MSKIIFGTYKLQGDQLEGLINEVIQNHGIRSIDTANLYLNEDRVCRSVAGAIKRLNLDQITDSKIPKTDSNSQQPIQITTKIWKGISEHQKTEGFFFHVTRNMTAYPPSRILLHHVMPYVTWRSLEKMYQDQLVQEIGVSNHSQEDLERLLISAQIRPSVNQIELHPFAPKIIELLEYCRSQKIKVEGHTILAKGKFFSNPTIVKMANKYGKTPAQIMISWARQHGADLCLSSTNVYHIHEWTDLLKEPANLFSQPDLEELNQLNKTFPHRFYPYHSPYPFESEEIASIQQKQEETQKTQETQQQERSELIDKSINQYVNRIVQQMKSDLQILETRKANQKQAKNDRKKKEKLVRLQQTEQPTTEQPTTDQPTTDQPAEPILVEPKVSEASIVFPSVNKKKFYVLIDAISQQLYPEETDPEKRRSKYRVDLRNLRKEAWDGRNNLHEKKRDGKICCILKRPAHLLSTQVANPVPMPVAIAPKEEMEPIFNFLRTKQPINSKPHVDKSEQKEMETFLRGTIFKDGRIDMCKQVVGPTHIQALCQAIQKHSENHSEQHETFLRGTLFADGRIDMYKQVTGPTHIRDLCLAIQENSSHQTQKIRHFLLGNNIACQDDNIESAQAIADLMMDPNSPIETWYLAGNCIGPKSIAILCQALIDFPNKSEALWLKRNPLMPEGGASIGKLLAQNHQLEILDLGNCGLTDQGIKEMVIASFQIPEQAENRLKYRSKLHLKHIYLDANGITPQGAEYLVPFFKNQEFESVYLSMNQLGDQGVLTIAESLKNSTHLLRFCCASNAMTSQGFIKLLEIAKTWNNLICLDCGYYKSTIDMGVLSNQIGLQEISNQQNQQQKESPSKAQTQLPFKAQIYQQPQKEIHSAILSLVNQSPTLEHLSLHGHFLLEETITEIIIDLSPEESRRLTLDFTCLIKNDKYGNWYYSSHDKDALRFVKHDPRVLHIDSIYRNSDK